MTHRVRSAFGYFLAFALAASSLAAQQTTGKIEGTVTDQAGVPIANAQVFVVGTSFGAISNERGYYFINNVPVGTHTIRGQFIGYAPAEVRNVRVQGGYTQTVDIRMQSSAVVLTGVTVSAQANPIVPRDQVATRTTVAGDLVDRLPVDDVRQIIALTPGVVESDDAQGVSIRGGRPGEANVYIDGAPVRGTNSGGSRVQLGTNAVEEASVTTGALGVEFSDAQSGIVSFTTRSGGSQLEGALSYATDEPFGDGSSLGLNRIEASIGGPVPGVSNLRFFGSTVLRGQLAAERGMGAEDVPVFVRAGVDQIVSTTDSLGNVSTVALPRYAQYSGNCGAFGSTASPDAQEIQNNYGFECQGIRRPFDWENSVQVLGKLQYTYGSGSSISLTGNASGDQSRTTPGTNLDNPQIYRGTHSWNRLAVLNLNHQVSRSAERSLAINANLSWARERNITGPLDPESEAESRSPFMGLTFKSLRFEGLDGFPFPLTEEIIRDLRTNSGTRGVPLFGAVPDVGQAGRINPFGLSGQGWWTTGFAVAASMLSETRLTGRVLVDWQANRYHRFTLGGDAKRTDLSFWSSNVARQIFMDAYLVKPVQYGLFAADRLDLGDVVLELGARWDYYNSNALFPNTPLFIQRDTVNWNPLAATDDTAYANSVARTFTEGKGHSTISPRLRVSFPITEQTGFRLSYSHQVQTPEFTTLLTGINNDLTFTNTNDVVGADLDFGKSILFEFGVRHAFSQDLVLDVSAYNKDKVSDFAARILPYPDPIDPTTIWQINTMTNRDFGTARGVDMKLDWRAGRYISTGAAYTYQISKNTGSDPFSYLNTFARQVSGLGDRTPPPEAAQRTDEDRTHSLNGFVALSLPSDFRSGTTAGNIFRDVSVFATFRIQSGLPYTRIQNSGDGQLAPSLAFGLGGRALEPLNSSELPWTKNVDVRVNKGISFGRMDLTLFADARNVFNFRNIIRLFAETGDVRNDRHRTETIGDPEIGSGEYGTLWDEADEAGALGAGNTVDLSSCAGWGSQVNCESLRRVEQRFGNGDGQYTQAEQERALNTFYDAFFGSWRMYDQGRHIRLGFEVKF